jgi:hypothetical protein
MLIRVHHVERSSPLNTGDLVVVSLWLDTPDGIAYLPVAALTDKLRTQAMKRIEFAASPAGKNIQLARKDELQVRVRSNIMYAGWSIPIALFPSQYVLPPACIVVEGYGEVKTTAYTIINPWGGRISAKQNALDAFVTFMHPASKYCGPGTDGLLVRDFVGTATPNLFANHAQPSGHRLIEKG